MGIRILDVTDDAGFALVPPCADAGFDHRSCDYWEDADRGSKAARASWLHAAPAPAPARAKPRNPFALDDDDEPAVNPFAPPAGRSRVNPFLERDDEPAENPFAPRPKAGPKVAAILSIVETCRRLKIPIREYLAAVLPGLADISNQRLGELTPTAWAAKSR